MPLRIDIVNPLQLSEWDNIHSTFDGSGFFHTAAWARVLNESYGYGPRYLTITNGNDVEAIVPLMEVRSCLTGLRGVSLPFTDYCDPLMKNGVHFSSLLNELVTFGKKAGWRYVELRCSCPLPEGMSPSMVYYGHVLDISGSEEAIRAGFRDSTRRNIKKAEKEGVEVYLGCSEQALREFYRLNCMTRRDHGLPCQPYLFFKNLHKHIIAKNLGMVALAAKDCEIVAGAVFLHFGDRVIYKYGASDRDYQRLRCNNLIFWQAIQHYREMGYNSLDFGRTEPENIGLLQFKRGWGTREFPINFCKYDFRRHAFVTERSNIVGWHNDLFRRMPIPLLKFAGSMLYKHIG